MTGYVYAIRCLDRIKIGWSSNPIIRFGKIEVDCPFRCERLGYWTGSKADEDAVHERFADLRMHGEWFAATPSLLKFIDGRVIRVDPVAARYVPADDDTPLIAWRKRQRITGEEVADQLGVTKTTYHRWERGDYSIPAKHLSSIEAVTGIPRQRLRPDIFEDAR